MQTKICLLVKKEENLKHKSEVVKKFYWIWSKKQRLWKKGLTNKERREKEVLKKGEKLQQNSKKACRQERNKIKKEIIGKRNKEN